MGREFARINTAFYVLLHEFRSLTLIYEGGDMATVFIEARPKGRSEGSPITDYIVEDHADHPLGTFGTQREAIAWAQRNGHSPHVARVRHLNDKKKPDLWRAV